MGRRGGKRMVTDLELEVLRAIWAAEGDPLTVRDVVLRLNRKRREPLAYTTVQTMMTILKKKKMLASRPGEGRAHAYTPRVSRDDVTRSLVGTFLDRLFDGRAEPLLARLLAHESLGRDELEALKRRIDEKLEDETGPPEGGRR